MLAAFIFPPRRIMSFRYARQLSAFALAIVFALGLAPFTQAEQEGKLQVLLLGDSTTIGSICRKTDPKGPHLEDVIRLLLAADKELPPVNVINQGRDGEYIHGLLMGRYEKDISKLPGIDYVVIRYGLNDIAKRENFDTNFPKDFHDLLARLRKDFPAATLLPTTIIPYMTPEKDEQVNALIRQVAEEEKLSLFDVYTRYAAELKQQGPNMLNYRRYALDKIPEQHRAWLKQFDLNGSVVVMDNRLDAHFSSLPGWFGDRHPNPAGYHVIGDETAKFLAKLIRERGKANNGAK
jgi:lysophospholipase L1-like esterase